MKKVLLTIGLCILFLGMSSATSLSIPKINKFSSEKIVINSADPEDAPSWAAGNFTGEWGLNVWGEDWIRLGYVEGYYSIGFHWDTKIGCLSVEYVKNGEKNGTTLNGVFFGSFLLGRATNETSAETVFVGIGFYNETSFRWRIMGETGPVLYMKGIFTPFE